MALNNVELQKLVQKAVKNDIDQKDMDRLETELKKRYNKRKLKSQLERIILAACVSYPDDLPSSFFYINQRMQELSEQLIP